MTLLHTIPILQTRHEMISVRKFDYPQTYRIEVAGHLDTGWSDWFDGFSIVQETETKTILVGQVADQAALHGLLTRIRDLGLPLLVVHFEETEVKL
jgi:hypothetical protein